MMENKSEGQGPPHVERSTKQLIPGVASMPPLDGVTWMGLHSFLCYDQKTAVQTEFIKMGALAKSRGKARLKLAILRL